MPSWQKAMTKKIIFLFLVGFMAGPYASAKEIAILLSQKHSVYNIPIESFSDTVLSECEDCSISVYDIEGNEKKGMEIINQLRKKEVDFIFTLGIKSTWLAGRHIDDIPILFSLVLNAHRYEHIFRERTNMCGITLQVPIPNLIAQYKLMVHDIKHIGILYNPNTSKKLVEIAEKTANTWDVGVVPMPAINIEEVYGQLKKHLNDIEGIWAIPDPELYNQKSFRLMVKKTLSAKKPFLTYSEEFVKAGALFAISVDYETIGAQAGDIAIQILEDELTCEDISIQAPIGTTWVVNNKTANIIGLHIPDSVSGQIEKTVGDSEDD